MLDQVTDEQMLAEMATKLRERFQEVLDEPVPQDILDLLYELERLSQNGEKASE